MQIAAISCIRDEGDIIETFVRVNSTFVDLFIFVDDSTDATGTILEKLAAEGFRIVRLFRQNKNDPYHQDMVVMGAIQYAILNHIQADFFLLLDSDEFPEFASKDEAVDCLAAIPTGQIGSYQWRTYIPEDLNFNELKKNALQSVFRSRVPEGVSFEKIIIPRKLADKVQVMVGSHGAVKSDGTTLGTFHLEAKLGHFPVRSPIQIIKKNVTAVYWLMRKKTRLPGEGYHVFETLAQLKNMEFNLTLESLQKLAVTYANDQTAPIVLGEKPNWIAEYKVVYQNLDSEQLVLGLARMLVDSWITPAGIDQNPELAILK
jgi:hypothetical protein